jgi:Protein of unknown function (DUF3829)
MISVSHSVSPSSRVGLGLIIKLGIGLSALSLLASPSLAQTAVEQARQAARPGKSAVIVQSPELRARIEKSNAYIALTNRTIRISDAWSRYASWVNLKTGPTGKERYIDYGIYSVYDVRGELEKARAAAVAQPSLPELDEAMKRYADAVENVTPIINRAAGYYDRKDHKADGVAEGKELHAKLVPAMETFLKARNEFKAVFKPFKNDLDQQELAAIEASDGKKRMWHGKNVVIHAAATLEYLPSDSAPVVEMKPFEDSLNAYAKAVRDLDNFVLETPGTNTMSNAATILGRLRDLREKLAKAKGDIRVAARSDMAIAQGLAMNMIVQDYNNMIRSEQIWSR